jgi:hypothetical protein
MISLTGCGVTVGTEKSPVGIKSDGVINGYATCNGFRSYDRDLIEIGVLGDDRWGNFASVDVWPIGGVGLSFFGARVKLLPFELGIGVFGYDPKPESYAKKECAKETSDEDSGISEEGAK